MAENMEVIVSALDQASEVFAQIAAQAQEMSDTIISTVDGAGSDFDNLGNSAGGAGEKLDEVGTESENMAGSMDSASQATDLLVGAMEGVVATELANALNDCIDTASSYQDQINSLSLTFGETTVNSEAFQNAISQASQTTGRAGSSIRDYFNQMGIAGVNNTSLLEQSFEALSGKAVQTGGNINSMASLMEKMVLSGNVASRSLTQLGLSTDDLGRVMGVSGDEAKTMFASLSQEERLRVLTQAMGDGTVANQMYKDSFSGMKQQLENQLGFTARNIGTSMLPILISGLQTVTPAINLFAQALGNPVIGGAVGVFGGVATALMGLTAATKLASIAIDGYKTAVTIAKTVSYLLALAKGTLTTSELAEMAAVSGNTAATTTNTAAKNAGAIASAILAVENGVLAVADGVVTAAQWALNAAMEANPIGIVILAVTALVAALTYLYYNNETVRTSINALGNALNNYIMPTLSLIWSYIENTIKFFQKLYLTFSKAPSIAAKMVTGMINYIKTLPSKVWSILLQVASRILSAGSNWLGKARTAGKNIYNGVKNGISGLAGMVYQEFVNIGSKIQQSVSSAVTAATNFGNDIKDAVLNALSIHSPGIIQRKTLKEFRDTISGISSLSSSAYNAGANVGGSILDGYDSITANGLGITTTSVVNTGNKGTFELKAEMIYDLKNVPSHINESTLADMIKNSDGTVVNAIANNLQFQSADLKMKNRISNRGNRARGV